MSAIGDAEARRLGVSESTTWVAELVAASPDGVFLADDDGVVVEVNDAWTRMLGYGRDGLPYRPPYPWWPDGDDDPDARAQLDAALANLLHEGSGWYEVPLQHRDGRRVWTSISVTSVSDPHSGRSLLVGTVRDVTQDRLARQRQQQASVLAQQLTEAASADAVLAVLTGGLSAVFGGRVHVTPVDADPPDEASDPRRWADADSPADVAVPGVGAPLRTGARQWLVRVAFDRPRRVGPDEHLILGLITAAAGQALQRVETADSQADLTAGLRRAAETAAQEALTWRAEAAARERQIHAERRFRSLVEAVNAVVWSRSPDGTVTEPQPSFAAWTGQSWPEHGGAGWLRMVHADDRDRVGRQWRDASGSQRTREVRHRLWHARTGEYRHVVSRAAAIAAEDGSVTEWLETITDVHDQVVAEQQAQRTAAVIDAILQASPVGFGWADPDLRLRHVNPALCRINGLERDEHLGRRPAELWGAEGRGIEGIMRQAMADGPVTGVEFTARDGATGRPLHRVASYVPIRIPGSTEQIGVGFTVVDVTERTRLLQALGEQRTRYERLAATDVLAVFSGVDDIVTEANDAFLTMLGYTQGDLDRGVLRWPDLTPPGWEEADARSLAELATSGRATAFTKEYLHRDGHRVPVLIGVVALERAPLRWLAYAADLTAERSAQAQSRLFQALVERSGDLVAVAGPDGSLRYLNPAGMRLVGGTTPAALTDLADEHVRHSWRDAMLPAVLRTGQHRTETRLSRRDTGAAIDVDLHAFTVMGDTADAPAVAIVARDMTERQRSLRRAQSLARFAAALSSATDAAAIAAAVTELAPSVLDASAAAVTADGQPGTKDSTGPHSRIPLRSGTRDPAGTLHVRWDTAVDDDTVRSLLHTVADLTSQAVQRTQLIASASAMADLAARLSVTRTPREAAEVILDAVPRVVGANVPILAVRQDGDRVQFHHRGVPESDRAGDAAPDGDPAPIIEAMETGRRMVPVDGHAPTVLPLHDSEGRPIAALKLDWNGAPRLSAADLAALDTVADLCEQTLERTRLVAAEHQLITRLAARLHHTAPTLPAQLDIAKRYRPAMTGLHLGGDWYDLISLPDDRLAIVVGDVVGHHIEAAADMAQLRTVINTLIRLDVPLEGLFARFTALLGRNFWGTAVVALIDLPAGRVDVVGAGHPHPILARPGRPPVPITLQRTAPLGLIQTDCQVTSVPVHAGDTLIIFTDGLIERRGSTYDDGEADLYARIAAAPSHATVDVLADAVLTAATISHDDQALVIVRFRGPGDRTLLRVPFTADDISDLRRAVRRCAAEAGLTEPRLDDFTIAVYELLTNAVRHGAGHGDLHLYTSDATLMCDVMDAGPGSPTLPVSVHAPDPEAVGGRGLWLARQLTDDIHVSRASTGGTHVTATMHLPP